MKINFTHHFATSFHLWFNNVLAEEGEAYINKTGNLYKQTDKRLSDGYAVYASPYKQWVYDSGQTGANIPTTVYVNGTGKTRSDGVNFDFDNGRVVFTGAFQPPTTSSVTCGYAVKELNVYLTDDDEESILMAANSLVNDRWGRTPSAGVEPYTEASPAVFVNVVAPENKPFALGGMDSTNILVKATIIVDDAFLLDGCLDLFRDKNATSVASVNFTGSPFTEFYDLKSVPFNYSTFVNGATSSYFIESVQVSKADNRINEAISNRAKVGFMRFNLSQERFPRI